jgi:hypothetical protein
LTLRNPPIRHYAHLGEVEGIATLVAGGYSFRADGGMTTELVSYRSPELVLHGLVDAAPVDPRPLWQTVADPATYAGTYRRPLVRGQ